MKNFLILSLLIMSSIASAQKKEVVATVNGKKIYLDVLEEYHIQNLNYVRSRRKVSKQDSLNDLVNRILGLELAKRNKLQNDPIVKKKMEDVLYHAQISKDLEGKLLKIKVSNKEVKSYYPKNKEYSLSQILLRLPVIPSPAEVKNALETMEKIYNEVEKNNDKFAEYAAKYSQASSSPLGGGMGFQPRARLPQGFYENIDGKSIGFISKPFRTQYGYHIARIDGERKIEDIMEDENLLKMYKKIIYDVKRDEIIDSYFKGLRSKARININKKALNKL